MTKDEAITLRARQLSGEAVDPFMFAVALRTIQNDGKKKKRVFRKGCAPDVLLHMLTAGPMERDEFYGRLGEKGYEGIRRARNLGLIKCEVRLTPEGLQALGLVGPVV
jgi:hypothetical protein